MKEVEMNQIDSATMFIAKSTMRMRILINLAFFITILLVSACSPLVQAEPEIQTRVAQTMQILQLETRVAEAEHELSAKEQSAGADPIETTAPEIGGNSITTAPTLTPTLYEKAEGESYDQTNEGGESDGGLGQDQDKENFPDNDNPGDGTNEKKGDETSKEEIPVDSMTGKVSGILCKHANITSGCQSEEVNLAGVALELRQGEKILQSTTTGTGYQVGTFSFTKLGEGVYRIYAKCPGNAEWKWVIEFSLKEGQHKTFELGC